MSTIKLLFVAYMVSSPCHAVQKISKNEFQRRASMMSVGDSQAEVQQSQAEQNTTAVLMSSAGEITSVTSPKNAQMQNTAKSTQMQELQAAAVKMSLAGQTCPAGYSDVKDRESCIALVNSGTYSSWDWNGIAAPSGPPNFWGYGNGDGCCTYRIPDKDFHWDPSCWDAQRDTRARLCESTDTTTTTTTTSIIHMAYQRFDCSARTACVEDLNLDIEDFVRFQCKCIDEHYEEFRRNGSWPAETTQKCKDFIGCLKNQHSISSRLVVSLARAIGKQNSAGNGGGLFEEKSLRANGMVTHATTPANEACFRPSNMSLAALVECDCLEDLVQICGQSLVEDTVGCLFDHACSVGKVCDDWKALNCPHHASHSEELLLLRQLFPAIDEAMDGKQNEGVEKDKEMADLEALRVKKQNEVVAKQKEIIKEQNEVFEIDEEMAAIRLKKQKASQRSSNLPKPNHKLPASIDSSGSSSVRDLLTPRGRAKASAQNNLQLQGNHDLSAESLDATLLGKCTAD
jgi:hypothetical protein